MKAKMRTTLCALTLLACAPVSASALDMDALLGGALGGAVGAVVGSEVGGRNGAILGGAIGSAAGVAFTTRDQPKYYADDRRWQRAHHRHKRHRDYYDD